MKYGTSAAYLGDRRSIEAKTDQDSNTTLIGRGRAYAKECLPSRAPFPHAGMALWSPALRRWTILMALSLPPDLLAVIEAAAAPIIPAERSQFINAVAVELERHPVIGAGVVHRVVAELQHKHTVEARGQANGAAEPRHFLTRAPTHRGSQHVILSAAW